MTDLKAYELKYGAYGMYLAEDGHKVDDNFVDFVYPKDQTDKVIAELKQQIEILQKEKKIIQDLYLGERDDCRI